MFKYDLILYTKLQTTLKITFEITTILYQNKTIISTAHKMTEFSRALHDVDLSQESLSESPLCSDQHQTLRLDRTPSLDPQH